VVVVLVQIPTTQSRIADFTPEHNSLFASTAKLHCERQTYGRGIPSAGSNA